jgi:hypothetical protein
MWCGMASRTTKRITYKDRHFYLMNYAMLCVFISNEKTLKVFNAFRVFIYSVKKSGFDGYGNHIFEQYLKRHGMSAALMSQEEFAITGKDALIVTNVVFAIVTVEIKVKLVEVKATSVLSITFCFFYLADQSRIHI